MAKKITAKKVPLYYDYKCATCSRVIDNINLTWKKIVHRVNGSIDAFCRECVSGNSLKVPDVWYGYGSGTHTEENICSPETGQPIPFYDKTSKMAAMKMAGVVEAGDRQHGARTTFQGGKHN